MEPTTPYRAADVVRDLPSCLVAYVGPLVAHGLSGVRHVLFAIFP